MLWRLEEAVACIPGPKLEAETKSQENQLLQGLLFGFLDLGRETCLILGSLTYMLTGWLLGLAMWITGWCLHLIATR